VPPRLALALVAAALLVTGCGTDKKQQYAQDFQKVEENFRSSVEKAGAQVKGNATLKERVPALRAFKASVDRLATDLDGLDAPGDLKRPNDDAVKQLHTLSADLGDYEAAATAGDEARARKTVPTLQADQTLLMKTLDELDAKVKAG
jgi:hypothetical protein